ncbi:cytochrome P450 [Dentipellis sp. KUC8613]|nr:cytochrome P450 [Dentipellis sp. KUC8613]
MHTYVLLIVSVGSLYALRLFLNLRRAARRVGNHPGLRTLVSGASIWGNLLPPWRGISPGRNREQGRKHLDFAEAGWDAYTSISVWPTSRTVVYLADARAIKEVTMSRSRFPKPVRRYKALMFFGHNIVASEHDEWKRYRKVSAPAFSEKNNKLVWDETAKIMVDMFDNVWKNQLEVTVDHCVEITLPVSFGRRISWADDLKIPHGHSMTFKDALHTVSTDVFLKRLIPDRALGLTKRFRHVRDAFKELEVSLLRMARKKETRYDLFSSLLDASEDTSDGKAKLSDSELVGNIFVFLIAGHETTAHTLCFTFALLALYPEQQERLHEDIQRHMPDPRKLPTYEEMGQFTWSMAVFYETLRMFPPVCCQTFDLGILVGIPKISAEDTSIVIGDAMGKKTAIPVPRGTDIVIHTPGLHYNPRYWENPHEFKPERFLGDWPKNAFLPFSAGARACLGRRFFETEGVASLTMLIARYKVEVKEEPEFANETFEERKARVLASRPGLTQTCLQLSNMGTKNNDDLMQGDSRPPASLSSPSVRRLTSVLLVVSVGGLYALQLFLNFRKAVQGVGNHPGLRTVVSGASILGNFLPAWRGISPGRNRAQGRKHLDFVDAGWDAYASISAWPTSRTIIFLADAGAIKEVTMSRARFPKPVERYKVLTFFGRNIVASEHDEWKRYRKVSAPAFSERNNKLVWDETVKIMVDMFDNVWKNQLEVTVDHCVEITLPIALFVIGVAGFGRRITWTDDLKIPPGHTMTFKDALHTVSTDVFLKLIIPDRAMGLTKRFQHVREAFKELDLYMLEMISNRRNAGKKEERYDLFSSLLDASEDTSDGDAKLSDSELVGNIFIFLVAGHETTAHTLCFTFALLALHPEQQERLYEDIKRQMSDPTRLPTYEEMGQFTWSMATFYETMRMFPPVVGIPKISAEDTSLVVGNALGEKKTIPIPRGTDIVIHTPGLHYNPRYWENPYEFNPERFLGDWPRDAFVPFSAGARACLGRRFFETEGIAILTMLISRYRVEVKEEPEFANETFEERKARVLASKPGLTQTPIRVPLVFKRRY